MEDIRPTAKWANRMLRPLTSIYHRLEKHHEILTSVAISKLKEKPEPRDQGPTLSTKGVGAEEGCSYSDEEPGDPAWVPGKKPDKRRIRHNYSSRGQKNGARRRSRLAIRSPELQKTLPGAIEIATPLITGKTQGGQSEWSSFRKRLFRNALPSVDQVASSDHRKPTRTNNSSFPAYQGSWKEVLDLSGDAGFVDIARYLDHVFLKLLLKTRDNNPQQGRGARSLLSMAARRLPEFIAEEQRLQDEVEEDGDVDMCDAYFTELEAHYAPHGNGWQPLREAVRARGIYLVSEMVQNGWVTKMVACRILQECLSQGDLDAFELLLSRLLDTLDTYGYPASFDANRPSIHCEDPVHILGTYYSRSNGRRSYVFDELSKLLLRRVLPPEWMVTTRWKKCVDGAIKSLSAEDGDSVAATRLIEAVVLTAGAVYPTTDAIISLTDYVSTTHPERPRGTRASTTNVTSLPKDQAPCPIPIQDALSNLNSSLITALCGMCIARSQAPGSDEKGTGVKLRNTIGHLALTVQRAIGTQKLHYEVDGPTFRSLRRACVLLGDCMLQCGEGFSTGAMGQSDSISIQNIESFFLSLASQHDLVKELAELVRQVFRCCGHVRKGVKTRAPKEIRTKVSQLAQLTDVHGISLLLGKVAAETAMGLAETTLDPDDHVWAMEVQENVVSSQHALKMKHNPKSKRQPGTGLYRWEESIGEWVASTPAPKARAAHLDVAPKQADARLSRPSTIACSTTSNSSSPSASDKAASSITSSAPSVSTKRAGMTEDVATRPYKRLRSTTIARCAGQSNDSPTVPARLPSVPLSEADPAPIAARTRTARSALKELPQAKNMPTRVMHRRQASQKQAPSESQGSQESASRIQVVIINKKSLPTSHSMTLGQYSEAHSEPIGKRTRLARRKSFPTKPDEGISIAPPAGPPTAPTAPIFRTQKAVPCSQNDESEDELSFL